MSFSRWRTLAGVTLASLCAITATAQAEMVQELDVAIKPSKAGTVRKPKPASIDVTISSPTADPSTTQTVDLFFSRGIEFNNRLFPTCTQRTIQRAKGTSRCPKGSIVGRGSARAVGLFGGEKVPESLTVTAVNGPGNTLLLYVRGTSPVVISDALVGRLTKASGQYGYKLHVEIPDQLRLIIPPDTFAPLIHFDVRVKAQTTVRTGRGRRARRAKVSYVETWACPMGGEWPFRAGFTFDQAAPFVNPPITAESAQKCS